MKIVRNKFIPFNGYKAINIFGILFCKENAKIDATTINHESIHTEQMKEILYILYYIWYGIEYLVRLLICWNFDKAYKNIGFEQEAYENQGDLQYLKSRKHYAWFKYF